MGCVLGGSQEESSRLAASSLVVSPSSGCSTLIAHGKNSEPATAAFINCLSSSALAFDDTHLATVTHPTGPVASALFAWAEQVPVSGGRLLHALAVGIELQCRLSNVLLLPPANPSLGLYITGVSGPVGVAAAVGRLMQLPPEKMIYALGLGAAQAGGFRATHGSMAGSLVPSFGARDGIYAAQLAQNGFTCTANAIEGPQGFIDVFSRNADATVATAGLGERFEMMENAYKPYPCGIVIHATIDACLEVAPDIPVGAEIGAVSLEVHPLALTLTDRVQPRDMLEAQVSLQHWTAVSLLQGAAGIAQGQQASIDDAGVAALRSKILAQGMPNFARNEARVSVHLTNGMVLQAHIYQARGSIERPLTDDELDRKFLDQAARIATPTQAQRLLETCRALEGLADVGAQIGGALLFK